MTYFPDPVFKLILSYCDTRIEDKQRLNFIVLADELNYFTNICIWCEGRYTLPTIFDQYVYEAMFEFDDDEAMFDEIEDHHKCECWCDICEEINGNCDCNSRNRWKGIYNRYGNS